MVQLANVRPSTALSTPVTGPAPAAGQAFDLLAEAANQAYKAVLPGEKLQAKASGAQAGIDAAKAQVSAGTLTPTGTPESYRDAIASIESAGSGGYQAQGKEISYPDGHTDRAYGRYQVMGSNVGPWTKQYFGQELTPAEFLANPKAQDAVFDGKFGDLIKQGGTPQDAASMWFTGKPVDQAGNPADANGTTKNQYVAKFNAAIAGNNSGNNSSQPTMIRASDGSLQPRLLSPASGPVAQAYNAAAGIAYQSQMLTQGASDLMDMSHKFVDDPQGYMQAAQAYVTDAVKSAPPLMKADLQLSLGREAQRRYLGVLDQQQTNIQQTAIKNSDALIKLWSNNYSESLASGDGSGAATDAKQLQSILTAREALPGSTWTKAQSDVVMQTAQLHAQVLQRRQYSASKAAWRTQLDTITKAAASGQTAADEGILDDPRVKAALPEQVAAARAAVTFREGLPAFNQATPADQMHIAQKMMDTPKSNPEEVALANHAMALAKANVTAWRTDPIDQARKVLTDKPPEINFATDPSQIISTMQARDAFAHNLVDKGYTQLPTFLDKQERATLGQLFGKDTQPETKLAIASAIVQGFGNDAGEVFKEIKGNETTSLMAGQLLAHGGNSNTSLAAMQGQQMLDQGLVEVPTKAQRVGAITPEMSKALSDAHIDVSDQGALLHMATAIYASLANGKNNANVPALMQKSIQMALGQDTGPHGVVTGGIQKVGSHDTYLPIGVSAQDAEHALSKAFGTPQGSWMTFDNAPSLIPGTTPTGKLNPAVWGAAADPMREGPDRSPLPMLGGKPLDPSLFSDGRIRLVPVAPDRYMMMATGSGGDTEVRNSAGNVYVFNLKNLIQAAQ